MVRCSSSEAVHLDLTGLSICTIIGTEIRSSVDTMIAKVEVSELSDIDDHDRERFLPLNERHSGSI